MDGARIDRTPSAADSRPRLGRDEVVAAALRLTRRVGLPGLTMRGLANELRVSPMAAYHWVPSKQALVDLVLEAVLEQVEVAGRVASGTWRDRLRRIAVTSRVVVADYPGVGAALLAAPAGPRARDLTSASIDLLREAGFAGDRLVSAWTTYHSFMLGHFTLSAMADQRRQAVKQAKNESSPRESDERRGGEEVGRMFAAAHTDKAFLWGLDCVLDALAAKGDAAH